MVVNNDGKVGIGTQTPAADSKLHVVGKIFAEDLKLSNVVSGTPASNKLLAVDEYGLLVASNISVPTGTNTTTGIENKLAKYVGTNGVLGETSNMYEVNNKVGIDNTDPKSQLQVGSGLTFWSNNFDARIGKNWYQDGATNLKIDQNQGGATIDLSSGEGVIDFYCEPQGANLNDPDHPVQSKMRIRNDGNIGIGTIDPSSKLEVRGRGPAIGQNKLLKLTNDWQYAGYENEPGMCFSNGVEDNLSNQISWTLSGKIASGSNSFRLTHRDGLSTTEKELLNVSKNGDLRIGHSPVTATPATEGSSGARVYFNGGTAFPFDLNGQTIYDSENTDPLFIQRHNSGSDQTQLRINIGDTPDGRDKAEFGYTENQIWNKTASISATGEVEAKQAIIMRPSPSGVQKSEMIRLVNTEIAGLNEPTITFENGGDPNALGFYAWKMGAQVVGGNNCFRISNRGNFGSIQADKELFRISENGNVGIGTTPVPAAKLQVKGNIVIEDGASQNENYNLRIGIFQPSAQSGHQDGKLFCAGKGVFKSLVIYKNSDWTVWPDYVFNKNYELLSLGETEKFIQKEKHLPGIPTEIEVNEKGVDLLEMNKILLKKVEEMTLHLIRMEKEIDLLKKQR